MLRFLLALFFLFLPMLAEAHPGHPGGDEAHMPGGLVGVAGVVVGVVVVNALWDKYRGRKWAPLPEAAPKGSDDEQPSERVKLALAERRRILAAMQRQYVAHHDAAQWSTVRTLEGK